MCSPLTAALHVVDLILTFILLQCGDLGAFVLFFYSTKNIGKGKTRHQQEASGASKSRIQKKHIKNFISESCSNFLLVARSTSTPGHSNKKSRTTSFMGYVIPAKRLIIFEKILYQTLTLYLFPYSFEASSTFFKETRVITLALDEIAHGCLL